jgi:hypothetical protein
MENNTRKAGGKGNGIKIYASRKYCNALLAFFLLHAIMCYRMTWQGN